MAAPRRQSHGPDGTVTSTPGSWLQRLTELARLSSTSINNDHERDDIAPSIHHHIDAIEALLRDPRPEITQELERCRPTSGRHRRRSESVETGRSRDLDLSERNITRHPCTGDHQKGATEDGIDKDEILSQLKTLMKEATALKDELRDRRQESNEIYDLYEERCRGLQRTVAELELEVAEL